MENIRMAILNTVDMLCAFMDNDAPDALTGIVESELTPRGGKIRLGGFTKR